MSTRDNCILNGMPVESYKVMLDEYLDEYRRLCADAPEYNRIHREARRPLGWARTGWLTI